jgi:hypothetical protein
MTEQERPKHPRGGQTKPAHQRKRNNLTFRVRDALKADLEKAAVAANRSVSEQIEYLLGRAFEWERVLGDLESFKARMAEEMRITEGATRHRAGWGKVYTPNGPVWHPPGTHNIPQSGFISEDEAAPPPTLPGVLRDAVRTEVRTAVREMLEEAGLLAPKKKTGGAAA